SWPCSSCPSAETRAYPINIGISLLCNLFMQGNRASKANKIVRKYKFVQGSPQGSTWNLLARTARAALEEPACSSISSEPRCSIGQVGRQRSWRRRRGRADPTSCGYLFLVDSCPSQRMRL